MDTAARFTTGGHRMFRTTTAFLTTFLGLPDFRFTLRHYTVLRMALLHAAVLGFCVTAVVRKWVLPRVVPTVRSLPVLPRACCLVQAHRCARYTRTATCRQVFCYFILFARFTCAGCCRSLPVHRTFCSGFAADTTTVTYCGSCSSPPLLGSAVTFFVLDDSAPTCPPTPLPLRTQWIYRYVTRTRSTVRLPGVTVTFDHDLI